MNQNQEPQVVITKVTFLEVREVEGGKTLIFNREYNTGAKDNESQSPVIASERFDEYIDLHIKQLENTMKDQQKELEQLEQFVLDQKQHLTEQIHKLESFKS